MMHAKNQSRWIEDLRNAFDPPLDNETLLLLERWVRESDPARVVDIEAGAARVLMNVMREILSED